MLLLSGLLVRLHYKRTNSPFNNDHFQRSSYRELLLWLFGKRWRLQLHGNSMSPVLNAGDDVLVERFAYRERLPEVDEIVVVKPPYDPNMRVVKRVVVVQEDGACYLIGDNLAESKDSRHYGVVSAENILGRVTSRFA